MPVAVADKCGQADFFFNPYADAGGALDAKVAGAEKRIPVRQITVDEFVKQNKLKKVDYIHVNIVGAELSALMGARSTLKEFAPKLAVCTYFCLRDKQTMINIIKESNPAYNIAQKCGKIYAWI